MAQTINTTINNGLFNAAATGFDVIAESKLIADLSDCKDAVTVIVDLSFTSGDVSFSCMSAKGDVYKSIALTAGVLNVFRIITHGIKKADGTADFVITASAGLSSANIRAAILKYVPVVNN